MWQLSDTGCFAFAICSSFTDKFVRIIRQLDGAGKRRAELNKPQPTIVIDNFDALYHFSDQLAILIQDSAKEWADLKLIKVLLICTDGPCETRILGWSAFIEIVNCSTFCSSWHLI